MAAAATKKSRYFPRLFIVIFLSFAIIVIMYPNVSINNIFNGNQKNAVATETSVSSDFTGGQNCKNKDVFEENLDQHDICLIETIRSKYLIEPSEKEYNLTHVPTRSSEEPVLDLFQELLPNKTGFFIECGANDGELHSNTIVLEMDYGWNGLLIEAQEETFEKLKTKNRKAWIANLCLSTSTFTQTIKFYINPKHSDVSALWDRKDFGETVESSVDCVPLFSILKALKISHVDYFSLDIEGKELEVLKTIPFDKITFSIFTVEFWFVPGGLKAVTDFLASKGYTLVKQIHNSYSKDGIYVNNSVLDKLKKPLAD